MQNYLARDKIKCTISGIQLKKENGRVHTYTHKTHTNQENMTYKQKNQQKDTGPEISQTLELVEKYIKELCKYIAYIS